MKTPDEFAQLMSDKTPSMVKRPGGDFTVVSPKPEPKLTGFEYVWCALPLGMVAIGGAVGGLLGGIAAGWNVAIFRSNRTLAKKYTFSALISFGSFIVWLFIAGIVLAIFQSARGH